MRFIALVSCVLFGLGLNVPQAQGADPDCLYRYHFTNRTGDTGTFGQTLLGVTSSAPNIKNVLNGCTAWSLAYNSEGLSALSIVLQDAPNSYSSGATPGTFVTFAGTTVTGSNPMTSTNAGIYTATGYYPWINVSLTSATGTGSVDVVLAGWKSPALLGALVINGTTCYVTGSCTITGGPTGAAGGDLSGTYPNPSVAVVSNAAKPTTGNVAAIDFNNITTIVHSLLFTDNLYDIGASAATRPRTGYFGTSVFVPWINTLSSGQTKTVVTLNSNGANYGTIQTETVANGGTWSLGYQGAASTTIGTNVITWNGNGFAGINNTSPGVPWDVVGITRSTSYSSATDCISVASPAVCGSSAAGTTTIAAAATTKVVNNSAVTANSEIIVTEDQSLGTKLSVTCNTQSLLVVGAPRVTARSTGVSFTVGVDVAPTTNPICFSYSIVN